MGHKNESQKYNADKSNPQSKDSPKLTMQLAQSWPLHDQQVKIASSVKYLVEHWTAGKKPQTKPNLPPPRKKQKKKNQQKKIIRRGASFCPV